MVVVSDSMISFRFVLRRSSIKLSMSVSSKPSSREGLLFADYQRINCMMTLKQCLPFHVYYKVYNYCCPAKSHGGVQTLPVGHQC